MSLIFRLVCVVCLAASALAGTATPPNVILITLDTTRADRMGFLGSKRGLTPNLDGLSRQSVVFTHAYAQAPLTSVSHATILTGTYPQFHQVLDFPLPLAKDLPYAPEILRAHGYHTAAFLGSLALDPAGGAPGFDRGFDAYDAHFHSEDFAQKGRYHSIVRRGEEVVAHALAWLNRHPKGPFFLWVHLYDAHDPYEPPEPYKTRYASEPYDGGIAYVDSAVGKLLQQLKVRGLYDGAVIAVMADHGESLGAHGEDTHGIFLYDETIQVPLVIKLPRQATAGKRIESRVELVDVLPTILQTARVEIPGEMQGESLLGLMKTGEGNGAADSWRDRSAYAQADYPRIAYGWSALQALRTGKYLYIQAPRRELYEEAADPKAEHNLATEWTAVADTLAGRLDGFRQKTSSKREAPTMAADPAAQEKLAALGYVASSNVSKPGTIGQETDPKDIDNIETVRVIRRVNSLLEDQRVNDAIPLLQQLIAKNDGISILYFKLGDCYMKLHEYDRAVSALRQAVELAPASMMARMNLGLALVQVQDFAAAVSEFENVAAKSPSEQTHLLLATAYFRTGRMPDAIKECDKVLEVSPDHYEATLLLGRALLLSGKPEAALPKLKKAAALQPKSPEPHLVLSNAYLKLGRDADAAQERFEATRLAGGRGE
jgi:arylsulfatase A-like enzyme/Flp pilus assembly protein TadD